ncbi:MAG TPA: Wzy polymerase domain-containing protein [Albitalea sp.]|uniref:PglL family O-oligosaccharyltransferase n=1 Tax=Piscinibacter sp. TaxID=1903157 RepID=UPI002ED56EA8
MSVILSNVPDAPLSAPQARIAVALATAAIVIPALLAFNVPPSATFLNQATSVVGWATFLALLAGSVGLPRIASRGGVAALVAALALVGLATLGSMGWASLPASLGLPMLACVAMAALTAVVAAAAFQSGHGETVFGALCIALVVAGVLSVVVGVVQVFAPDWADGNWIAPSAAEGRASGNLRQPNHLSSLLLWSIIAAIWLTETKQVARAAGVLLLLAFLFVLVLAASRTGVFGVAVLAVWGVTDRRLTRQTRAMLLLAPLIYLVFFGGLSLWAHSSQHVFGGEARLSESESPNSRWNIWANTLALIAAHPWRGVGLGEFNFAWSLTPFPHRPTAFFDHTHDLPLQLAVEMGLPLAVVVLALLSWALWRAFAASRDATAPEATLLRAAWMMVVMIGVHSLFEYPLWYAYFLLPAAFAWGLCLGASDRVAPAARGGQAGRAPALMLASVLMLAGGVASVADYLRVVAIFSPDEAAPPLSERIAAGQRSWFFAHHADYAAATTAEHPSDAMSSFKVATHYLLDTRIMMAWATALHESGDDERARFIAQRLREFRNEDANAFFEACNTEPPAGASRPFQCTPPTRSFDYRDFR